MSGWFKVVRADRDKILTHCGEKAPGVLAVWLAFCDLANLARGSRFRSSGSELARVAGMSRRHVERVVPILRRLGLVTWRQTANSETGGLEANEYHLPTLDPSATMTVPLPSDCRQPTDNELAPRCRSLDSKTVKTEKTNTLQPAPPPAARELPLGTIAQEASAPKAKRPREPDPCYDALAELDGGPAGLSPSAQTRVAVKLASIRKVDPAVTPEEICRRGQNLRSLFPNVRATAASLESHWAECATQPKLRANGSTQRELSSLEAELRKLASPTLRELQDPLFQRRRADLQRRRAELVQREAQ